MTISLINKEQVVNNVKHRYGIYLLLHCSNNKNYAVISRSGIFKKSVAKSSLLSGKIYSDREEAVQRYDTLLSSAYRRNFEQKDFDYSLKIEDEWEQLEFQLKQKNSKKQSKKENVDINREPLLFLLEVSLD